MNDEILYEERIQSNKTTILFIVLSIIMVGLFLWRNARFDLDDIRGFMKYGGAGIHFMTVHRRYRASVNFLEYPSVLINFKQQIGPVQDLSFSTKNPDRVMQILQGLINSQ